MSKEDVGIQSCMWESNSVLKEKRECLGKKNYMPFLFRSKRQFPDGNNDQSPPVGSYSISGSMIKTEANPHFAALNRKFTQQNQMGIFKSKNQRFVDTNNPVPGPASYNLSRNATNPSKQKDFHKNHMKNFGLIKAQKTCSTIPDVQVKFGYTKDSKGVFKVVEKTDSQIEKEKMRLKLYYSTLVGEFNYKGEKAINTNTCVFSEKKVTSDIQKFVDQTNQRANEAKSEKKVKRAMKPNIKLSHPLQLVQNETENLGPGHYNTGLDTIKKSEKRQQFQFFGSTKKRFEPVQKESLRNPYEHIFNSKRNSPPLKPNENRKIYKKSSNIVVDADLIDRNQNPGPGQYEPDYVKCKKKSGGVLFGYQSRWKESQEIEVDHRSTDPQSTDGPGQCEKQRIHWGNLKKEKIKSPNKRYEPVKQEQIYGIMNEHEEESFAKPDRSGKTHSKKKPSPVSQDKSQVFKHKSVTLQPNAHMPTFVKKVNPVSPVDRNGSYISRLQRESISHQKEETPGPGAYREFSSTKKSFNVKS